MPNAFGVLSPNLTQNKEKMKNFFLSFFHVSDDSGGGHQGAKFFFRFLAVSGHSESILIFCKIDPIGGGGGRGDQKSSFAIKPK